MFKKNFFHFHKSGNKTLRLRTHMHISIRTRYENIFEHNIPTNSGVRRSSFNQRARHMKFAPQSAARTNDKPLKKGWNKTCRMYYYYFQCRQDVELLCIIISETPTLFHMRIFSRVHKRNTLCCTLTWSGER